MEQSAVETLPPVSSLSPSMLSFLNDNLRTSHHLHQAPALLAELHSQSRNLDSSLSDLNQRLAASLLSYASYSGRVDTLFHDINANLSQLRSNTDFSGCISDGGRSDKVLGEELPSLAKEVARVEAVRTYAETALKLDTLVGDIEDAVSSSVNRNLRKHPSAPNSEEVRLVAIKALKQAEDVLASVTKARPQWLSLVSAVDHRIDRALAISRPQAIADHRSLLASLGWPPPLSTLNSKNLDSKSSTEVSNPLFTMQGDLKHQYCENFLALCRLQELQGQRNSRQLQGHDREVALHQPLWGVEELVNPLSIASQRHFSKWVDKPEYIFALVFKITRDCVDSMNKLLHPLVDEAMLSSYSCREEWISAIVTSLSMYMAKEMFPLYTSQLDEENGIETPAQAKTSWLHLVDLMICFDKKVQSLLLQSGIFLSLEEDKIMQKILYLFFVIDLLA